MFFFDLVALINVSKNKFNVFFLIFVPHSLIRFLILFWSKTEKLDIVALFKTQWKITD